MGKHGLRIWTSVIILLTFVLANCSGGGNAPGGQATSTVPAAPMATATTVMGSEPTTASTEASTAAPSPSGATTETAPAEGTSAATSQAVATSAPWKGEQIGGTVSVLAVWGGAEQDAFMDVIKPFQEQTGINVQYEGTRDLAAVLNTRIQGGNPPDVAGVPNPGQLVALAQAGSLKPLDDVLDMNVMKQQYDPGFLNLASVDGKLYGIFTKAAVKSLVWYNPKAFTSAGYQVPKTWDELKSLEQKIISDGKTPWCVGIDGGAGSGWPGTDWVEDILLHQAGPDVYDQWVKHEIPWTDPSVKAAFDTWGTIVNDEKMVYGGPQTVISTNFGQAFNPMFQDDPGCFLHKQADFITTFFLEQFPNLKAGEDYNFFVFPTIEKSAGTPLEVAGDLFGMFNDTPQARALMQYLVTADAQSIWAKHGGFLSANKTMDPANYPDPLIQQIGEMLTTASSVRFDGSDQLPQGVESTFSQGVLQYPGNPDQLDTILQSIESVAQEAYPK